MDLTASAAIVLSAAGRTGHEAIIERAGAIVSPDLLEDAAEAYKAMDERREIKVLLAV